MRILIIEDSAEKLEKLISFIRSWSGDGQVIIDTCDVVNDGLLKIGEQQYDLIIIDLLLPQIKGAPTAAAGDGVLRAVEQSAKNNRAHVVAITKYPAEAESNRDAFRDLGALILEFSDSSDQWAIGLKFILNRIRAKTRYDFIIFCALKEEAKAFSETDMKFGSSRARQGVPSTEVELNKARGLVVTMPQMGLVDTAILASKMLENFDPSVVVMSGICGGIEGKSELGQLIVADPSWEYQSGKITENGLLHEPYQIRLPERTRASLDLLIDDKALLSECYEGLPVPSGKGWLPPSPAIAPMASGSAVVADLSTGSVVETQHRKSTAIEMEVFAFYRAAFLARPEIQFFAAKVVVDFCNPYKNDSWHSVGTVVSARFCVAGLRRILDQ